MAVEWTLFKTIRFFLCKIRLERNSVVDFFVGGGAEIFIYSVWTKYVMEQG